MAVTALLGILAMAVLPTVKAAQKRAKETELRRALQTLRDAIDDYKLHCDAQSPLPQDQRIPAKDPPYPAELDDLLDGGKLIGSPTKILRILRRIPEDPMTGNKDWSFRCFSDRPDATSWCGKDIYDVRSKSTEKGTNGEPYSEW